MLSSISLDNILFLDIETVPEQPSFSDLNKIKQELFANKTKYQRKEDFTAEEFYERAGIWAEFGKIVCISVGFFDSISEEKTFRLKSFYSNDEVKILTDFKSLLEKHFSQQYHVLCQRQSFIQHVREDD